MQIQTFLKVSISIWLVVHTNLRDGSFGVRTPFYGMGHTSDLPLSRHSIFYLFFLGHISGRYMVSFALETVCACFAACRRRGYFTMIIINVVGVL